VLMGRTAHLGAFSAPGRRDRDIAAAALTRLGLAHLADSVYTRVSGGERQLTLIARALAQEASLIVMDEPTANLDFGNQIRVLEQVRNLAGAGIGVLLSTHDPDHAFLCADRVVLLRAGTVLASGAPDAVLTEDALLSLYGITVRIAEVDGGLAGTGRRRICVPGVAGRE